MIHRWPHSKNLAKRLLSDIFEKNFQSFGQHGYRTTPYGPQKHSQNAFAAMWNDRVNNPIYDIDRACCAECVFWYDFPFDHRVCLKNSFK